MSDNTGEAEGVPDKITAIKANGFVTWAAGSTLSADFKARFDAARIPVEDVRHLRVWGLQVDDERALPGHERTSTPDEELWEVRLRAKDGSTYEVDSAHVEPAPEPG